SANVCPIATIICPVKSNPRSNGERARVNRILMTKPNAIEASVLPYTSAALTATLGPSICDGLLFIDAKICSNRARSVTKYRQEEYESNRRPAASAQGS